MKLTTIAAAAALLGAASLSAQAGSGFVSMNGGALTLSGNNGAVATPYNLGTLDTSFTTLFVTVLSSGSFSEFAQFDIPPLYGSTNGASNTYALTITLPGPTVVTIGSISTFTMEVVSGTPASPGASVGGPYGAGASFTGLPMSPGTYHLAFVGSVSGVGGQYSASIQAIPVPEPETYAMMLAGIGAISFVAWRRRRQG